jgi:hypothetical protein
VKPNGKNFVNLEMATKGGISEKLKTAQSGEFVGSVLWWGS